MKIVFFILQFVVIPIFIITQKISTQLLIFFDMHIVMINLGFPKSIIKIIFIILSVIPATVLSAHYLKILQFYKSKYHIN
jgi:hypothetical protein